MISKLSDNLHLCCIMYRTLDFQFTVIEKRHCWIAIQVHVVVYYRIPFLSPIKTLI